eukprot:TRINITY_DN8137_c0_g1_i1.p1 TRINITY_DN8137_c0_g1~~TRINITY_DN8137_c0_g1_i1.p1  ORF type:complete len:239 (-),score=76.47 TRINITY_DN8137_c0_g1_i1:138-854(-)
MASNFDPYQSLQTPSTSLNMAPSAPLQTDNATDDDDSDSKNSQSYKERRREAHTAAEQKRRDAIKKGYDSLQELVPTCLQTDASGHKVSKAVVLQKSIDYIQYLAVQKKKQETDLNSLRKEVVALQIMRANYEQLVKAHQRAPQVQEDLVPDEVKFQVFQVFMDSLFQSFNQQVSMNNFAELSGCVFSWIEEQCKPGDLQDLMYAILKQTSNHDAPQEVLKKMGLASSEPIDPAYQRN